MFTSNLTANKAFVISCISVTLASFSTVCACLLLVGTSSAGGCNKVQLWQRPLNKSGLSHILGNCLTTKSGCGFRFESTSVANTLWWCTKYAKRKFKSGLGTIDDWGREHNSSCVVADILENCFTEIWRILSIFVAFLPENIFPKKFFLAYSSDFFAYSSNSMSSFVRRI